MEVTKLLFNVPIVLITLLDEDRQWFKARRGLEAEWTKRSVSFCGHAIHADSVMVVDDALADERFRDNPLVAGSPFIRFYAGAPLRIADDIQVGTLCLIDQQTRSFDEADREVLARLAEAVRDELVRSPAPSRQELARHPDERDTASWCARVRRYCTAR